VTTRLELPLSGRSSELFSPGRGWQDTGVFGVLLDGWSEGENEVLVGNVYGDEGLVSYGADFVGLLLMGRGTPSTIPPPSLSPFPSTQ